MPMASGSSRASNATAHSHADGAGWPGDGVESTIAVVRRRAEIACCWSSIRVTSPMNQAPSDGPGPVTVLDVDRQAGDALGAVGERGAEVGEAVVGGGDAPEPGQRLADDAVATAARHVGAAHGDAPRPGLLADPAHLGAERPGLGCGRSSARRRSAAVARSRSGNCTVSASA